MRRFEFNEGKSNKYWQIAVHDDSYTVQYGKIGTTGRSITKDFSSHEAAIAEAKKKVSQKEKKGYVELASTGEQHFNPIYLVHNEMSPVAPAKIDELERIIGSLPDGYREFMHRCGGYGALCDDIQIWPPELILEYVASEREYLTFQSCLRWESDTKGLTESDFDDLWVFGADGVGSHYSYFPKHEGTLFNLLHGGGVVRHDRAFCDIGDIWSRGIDALRHPFPFFSPRGLSNRRPRRIRGLPPTYSFSTNLNAADVAEIFRNYWFELGERVKFVEMPRDGDHDRTQYFNIFVKRLNIKASVVFDPTNHPGKVYGGFSGDYDHRVEFRKFFDTLKQSID